MRVTDARLEVGTHEHVAGWSVLRRSLWPEGSEAEHSDEIKTTLAAGPERIGLVALVGSEVIGFAEASLRHDYVNGCDTSPVAFLEGIYVRPDCQRAGIARQLCARVEEWGRALGCLELGSDAGEENADGAGFHAATGFSETERVVFFRKRL